MKHLIDKDDLVAIIKYHMKEVTHSYFCKCLLSEIDEHLKVIELKDPWKPTNEQMEALEWSLGDYRNVIFEERHDTLVSLYNSLKELKGE
jgi:hypothetical protein